jgi:FHS family L-fucose permease-like MFS transporter
MLVQSAFFVAYFLVSLPAAKLVEHTGYMRGAVVGLLVMMLGCLLFIPASQSGVFFAFLGALFVLACGVTIVQVVANPLISMLGPPKTTHSRLTFAQAFNSLGTTVFPYVGASLILGSIAKVNDAALSGAALTAFRAQETHVITRAYLGIAAALAVVALAVWVNRKRLVEQKLASPPLLASFNLLMRPRFALGTLSIFLYVGAEVAVASLMVNYLMQADTLGLAARQAGQMIAFYWGGAMIGRFVGAGVLRRLSPALVLSIVASAAITCLAVSGFTRGPISAFALIAIGCCNAIMFPTIFSLACEGLGPRAAEGSGIICMAIVGGAVVPLLTGGLADISSLRIALVAPAACYLGIVLFGRYCGTRRQAAAPSPG